MSADPDIYLAAPCKILVRSKFARRRLNESCSRLLADYAEPLAYRCRRCGLEWDADALDEWWDKTCSNCYSDSVLLTKARMVYQNWGRRNGGKKAQTKRRMHGRHVLKERK